MKKYEEIRTLLSVIEPQEEMYSSITVEDIPLLKKLLNEGETWLAARAIFALSRLNLPKSHAIIIQSLKDKRSEIRIAIAAVSNLLPNDINEKIYPKLLLDEDLGVKKFAIQSLPINIASKLLIALKKVSVNDNNEYIKKLSLDKIYQIQK